jgi:hypothetical protein
MSRGWFGLHRAASSAWLEVREVIAVRAVAGRLRGLRSVAAVGLTSMALLAGGVVGALPAQAATIPTNPCVAPEPMPVTTRPVLTRVTVSPTLLDVRRRAKNLVVTLKAHDTVAITRAVVTIGRYPAKTFSLGGDARLVSGTAKAGTWRVVLRVPRGVPDSRYQVRSVWLWDAGRAAVLYEPARNKKVDWPAPFRIRSIDDQVAPTVSDFRISTRTVDTRTAAQTITLRADVHDPISGVAKVHVEAHGIDSSLEPAQAAYHGFDVNLARSTSHKNRWVGHVVIPTWVGVSTWRMTLLVKDNRRHVRYFPTEKLAARGWQSTLRVTSARDGVKPTLTALSFTPTSVDARTGAVQVDVTYRVTDPLSGTAPRTSLDFSGNPVVVTSTTGTAQDRTYHGHLVVPQCGAATQSTWVVRADLYDNAGNENWIGPTGITDLGLPDELTIQQRDAWAPQIINDPTATAGGSLPLRFSEPVIMAALPSSLLRVAVNGTTAAGTWVCRSGTDDVVVCDADDAAVTTATFTPTTAFVKGQRVTVTRVNVPPARSGIYDLDGVPLTQVAVDNLVG